MENNIMVLIVFIVSLVAGYLTGRLEERLETNKELDKLNEELTKLKKQKETKPRNTSNFADPLAGYMKLVDKDSKLYVPVKDKTGRRRRVEQRIEIGQDDRF